MAAASVARELKDIEKKKTRAINKGDFAEASRLCNSAGELLASSGFYTEAVEWHKEEVVCSETANDILGAGVGHRKIGECLCELNDFEGALKHQRRYLKVSQTIENKVEEQRALATIGRTLFVMSDSFDRDLEREKCLKESLDVYLKSFSLANKLRDKVSTKEMLEMRARLCLNIGLVYEWRNQLDHAQLYMEKALVSSRENSLKENMYRCYLSLSGVTAKNHKLQESLRYAKRAQHIAKEKGSKTMEADALLQLGQVFIKLGVFSNAVKLLRESYKVHAPTVEGDKETLLESLKQAVKGEKFVQQLENEKDEEEKLKLVEKLGDIFSEAKSSEMALSYYQQQLELCHKLNRGSRAIATIYVSLAITYAENGNVDKALEFYRKELDLRKVAGFDNDFKEMCATFSAMAKLLEDSECDKDTVIETYNKAVECAEKSGSTSCLLRVYKELSDAYRKFDHPEEDKEIQKKIKKLEKDFDEDEDDSQSTKEEESENLEELLVSSSDSSDEENETRKNTRVKRKKANKVNERGETPLHLACINGNLQKAKELLQTGASVHSRDFCGWQPLHEACNFGHTEIARLLLAYGANVNDIGGDHCAQVTPLHDAAQNGHLETVHLLIEKGANAYSRDAKGRTPCDLVEAAIKTDEEELEGSESELLQSRKEVRNFLRQVMLKSRSEPQLRSRNRNVLEQFADENMDSSDEELSSPAIRGHPERQHRSTKIINDELESSNIAYKTDHYDTEPRFESDGTMEVNFAPEADIITESQWPHSGFEKISSNLDNDVNEVGGTDEDSTYASMDEDGIINHSPIKPLEPIGTGSTIVRYPFNMLEKSNEKQSFSSTYAADSVGVIHAETNDLLPGPSEQQERLNMEYNPNMGDIAAFTSESDSDTVELIDGFIVDDIGQRQARKKRRIDGFPRKKSIQQKITIPGNSSANLNQKRETSNLGDGLKSQLRLSKSKNVKQSRITGSYSSTSRAPSHRSRDRSNFTVNDGTCSSVTNYRRGISNCGQQAASPSRTVISPNIGNQEFLPITSSISGMSQQLPVASLRVRVRIEKELLLIPCVDHGERKTIKWLTDQASQRYSSSKGVTPNLILKTKEGALLSEQDFISDVLVNNEEVNAQIVGWDSGSICEKYETECAVLGIVIRKDILQLLSPENELSQLFLPDFNLSSSQLKALSKSLAGHSILSKIDITGNFIGDNGIECFCSAMQYLPSLISLNLSCSGMTSKGLSLLANALSFGCHFRKRHQNDQEHGHPLEELDCSFNSLETSSIVSESLVKLMKICSRLSKLKLDHSFLAENLFSNAVLRRTFKDCLNLTKLSLAGNKISSKKELFLALPKRIQEIDLSGCFPEGELQGFEQFFQEGNSSLSSLILKDLPHADFLPPLLEEGYIISRLEHLNICNSNISRGSLTQCFSNIAKLKSLKRVDFSGIQFIDSKMAESLMQNLVSASSPLSVLKMKTCNITNISDDFCKCCEICPCLMHIDLSFNDIYSYDKEKLVDSWQKRFSNSAVCISRDFCLISISNFDVS